MKTACGFLGLVCFLLLSCNSDPSLQKYFVENTENKDFIVLDVSSTILNVDQTKLSVAQKEALHSFDKMNVLAFKLNDNYYIDRNRWVADEYIVSVKKLIPVREY